ncbi:hypothetical protein [Halobaculum gomorrense]|uniref:Uncharacterized protein n=1 Tax=Halobaculum gomorrense TaxID=43928 RepID=A0A1M5UJZ9_9EURY|nr:hypothetical protein [Halobaculum gomorrense]SHH63250.1 hypothetical protein SAMN05443636_3043 [Halobaculum gomorrense]
MSLFERVTDAFRESGAREDPERDAGEPVTDSDGAGGSGDGPVGGGPANERTDAIVAVCQRATDGVRTYTIEIDAAGAEITEVAPGLLEAHFEVAEGGVGADHVTVRAVDFRGEARTVEAETLVGVRFAESVPLSDVQMRLVAAEDHGGDTLPSELFRIAAVE